MNDERGGPWRDIPGFDGAYQVNDQGDVRSWRLRGREHFAKEPRMMVQFVRKRGKLSHRRYVKLTRPDGKSVDVAVLKIMVDVWMGGERPGMVPYHINGDLADHCVNNIGFKSRRDLGKLTGAAAKRKPVAKVDEQGEVVAVYSSARAAARANHMSYQTVLDRCNGKVKKPYALDGHTYVFDR
jgi:hypothetical protein